MLSAHKSVISLMRCFNIGGSCVIWSFPSNCFVYSDDAMKLPLDASNISIGLGNEYRSLSPSQINWRMIIA
jgi:hypothetical protein